MAKQDPPGDAGESGTPNPTRTLPMEEKRLLRSKLSRTAIEVASMDATRPDLKNAETQAWELSSQEGQGHAARVASSKSFCPLSFQERYETRRELGAGGMGEVNLCVDHTIGRKVAMKSIKPRSEGSQAVMEGRFLREARIQGQLEHPAIVPVYDIGADPDGRPYFTMKRIRGHGLNDVLSGLLEGKRELTQRFSRRKLLSVFSQVCMAVDFAHSRGVIHRDLKPANIMLGDFGEVYVLDWGVAGMRPARSPSSEPSPRPGSDSSPERRPDSSPSPASEVSDPMIPIRDTEDAPETIEGQVMGTPGYMAPEQIQGQVARIDERADIYALGVILYEVLTLQRAHRIAPLADVMVSTLSRDGLTPSQAVAARAGHYDLHQVTDAGIKSVIGPELDQLCWRATRLEPENRLASAGELARGIESFLDGDRDLALRRQMARKHAETASAALSRSVQDDADEEADRGQAMRQVTTALGLDPNNVEALQTLVQLLTEPPRVLPEGARATLHEAALRAFRLAAKVAIAVYFGFIIYVPFTLWTGVRSWSAFILLGVSIASCAALTFYYLRRPPPDLRLPWPHIVVTTFAAAVSTVLFGPFIVVPLLALGNSVCYICTLDTRWWTVIAANCLAIAAPAILQWAGVLPPSYVLEDGVMTVLPQMIELSPTPIMVFLLFAHVALVISASLFVVHLRTSYQAAERQLHLQAWQLGHIVPEAARSLVPRGQPSTSGARASRASKPRGS